MKTIQNDSVILRLNHLDISIFDVLFFFIIDIFYPPGEPLSLQSLRCSPFAVDHYSFRGHCLAFAAISIREKSKILSS
jgi:hypothetical protein